MDERLDRQALARQAGVAACSVPEAMPLVDAAFERSGGREAQQLKRYFCAVCPVQEACFYGGMGEFGVWGGVGQKQRTRAGAPSPKKRERAGRK